MIVDLVLCLIAVGAWIATAVFAIGWLRYGNWEYYDPRITVCGVVAAGITVYELAKPLIRRFFGSRRRPVAESLIVLLKDRAKVVRERVNSQRKGLRGDRADRLLDLLKRFIEWHEKHIEALRQGNVQRVHATNATIQQIIAELNREFMTPEAGAVYSIISLSLITVSYPGPRPTDLPPDVPDEDVRLIWEEEEKSNAET